jgi:hypothetical protein
MAISVMALDILNAVYLIRGAYLMVTGRAHPLLSSTRPHANWNNRRLYRQRTSAQMPISSLLSLDAFRWKQRLESATLNQSAG